MEEEIGDGERFERKKAQYYLVYLPMQFLLYIMVNQVLSRFFQGCDSWKYQTYSRERREGLHQSGKPVSEQDIFRVAFLYLFMVYYHLFSVLFFCLSKLLFSGSL